MKQSLRAWLLGALALTFSGQMLAQVNTGSVAGTVKDQSGAVVPNATVTATNTETQLSRTATSDSNGGYNLNALPPGTYEVKASAPNFNGTAQRIQVTVGSRNALDLTLGVASTGTTVEVVGEGGSTVNTVDQQVSTVVNTQQMLNLPTLTRDPYALVATASNVQQDSQAGMGDARGAGFSINGQRSASTDILLDGAENVDTFTATAGQTVPLDSVQEFRVITNGMTAEYGRASGGVVNVATKSGTNAIHGSAYEYNRISALASNTYDNVANGTPKPVFTRNQFGGSIGGPIVKNRLFFFDNAEWIRVRSVAPQIAQVPDPAFIAAASPATRSFFTTYGKLRPDVRTIGTVTRSGLDFTPLTGGRLAALPGSTPVLDTVTYNAPSNGGAGNPQNTWENVARVDFNLTDRTQMFGSFKSYKENDFAGVINTSPYAGFETGQNIYDQNALFSLTHTFSASMLSNTRLVWSRLNLLQPLGTAPVGPTLYTQNNATARVKGHLVAFPGYNEYTPGSAIPFGGPQNFGEIYEDITWTHGTHTFRFGGQYMRIQDNRAFGAYEEAVEALSTSSKASGFDNFLAGTLSSFQAAVNPQGKFPCFRNATTGAITQTPACTVTLPVGPPSFSRSNLYNDGAAYAQDSWKLSPRLTLDYGLRWEYYGVQHNRNPQLDSNFYYGTGNTIFDQIRGGFASLAPSSPIGGLWKPNYKNFGPRIGFAYDLLGDGTTSIRGGYGIGFERNFGNVTFNVIQNPPNYAVVSITPSDVGTIPVTTSNAGPLAGSTGSTRLSPTSLRAVDPHIKTAYVHQWNLTLERQLNPNLTANLGYNGAHGLHQYSISNINEPGMAQLYLGDANGCTTASGCAVSRMNYQYSNINFRGSNGDSYYHAFVAGLRGKVKGITTNANYTYSHSIDTLSSTFSDEVSNNGLGYLDPFNPQLDRGSSDYDARHRVSVSMVWDTPWFSKSGKFLSNTLGGWSLAPIFSWHTGYPFTLFDSTNELSPYNAMRAELAPGAITGPEKAGDLGGNLFDYMGIPVNPGQYEGPQFIPGTRTPMTVTGSNLPTCTGLFHQGCSFPSNMAGRNSFRGPGVWDWTMGVYKNFKITERVGIQLRGEFYDILNHKNMYVLGYTQGGADISGSGSNFQVQTKKGGYGNPFDERRNTQLALRITF